MGTTRRSPKYLVANADEMEPGTFKDRLLIGGDPHQLIEGMIVAAYAIEADVAYVFLRGEYKLAAQRLSKAIAEAYAARLSGPEHSWVRLQPRNASAHQRGRYMCGEETGLLNALEGKRANPRAKPPFPPVSGLWGKPTTSTTSKPLQRPPHREQRRRVVPGAEPHQRWRHKTVWRQRKSEAARSCGNCPWAPPYEKFWKSTPGGMRDGLQLSRSASWRRVHRLSDEQHLDVPMDFTEVQKAGSRMGTGTMIVLDDQTCPVGMVWNLEHFFAQESCGWCTPCWSGLAWAERILQRDGGRAWRAGRSRKARVSNKVSGARAHLLRPCAGRRGAASECTEILSRRF